MIFIIYQKVDMSDMVSVMKKSAEFEEEKAASLTRMANAQFLEHCTSADKDEIVASELAVMQIRCESACSRLSWKKSD